MEKLEQLDDLIEEKEQESEEWQRQQERNKIIDEKDNWWRKKMNETIQAYLNKTNKKKKQLDVLLQQ